MEASRFRITPGGYEALLGILRDMQSYVSRYAPAVRLRLRRWYIAEASSGDVSVQLLFPDERTRAAVLDQMRIDGSKNPMESLLRADRPPATLVQRVWMDSTDPDVLPPPDREVVAFSAFEVRPGRAKEAAIALAETERRDRRLGAETELWVVRYGSAAYGRYIRGMSFDSFEELRAFDEVSENAEPATTPVDQAVQAGVLDRVTFVLTTSVTLE